MATKGGQPGNKNATKERRMITDALRKVVAQGPDKLKKACEKLLDNAADGDIAAFNVIADRLDGRPAQSMTIGGDSENPLVVAERPQLTKDEWLKKHGIE